MEEEPAGRRRSPHAGLPAEITGTELLRAQHSSRA